MNTKKDKDTLSFLS